MANSQDNGRDDELLNGAAEGAPSGRAARRERTHRGEKAGAIFLRPLAALHSAAGHDDAADGVDHRLRHSHLQSTGGERSAGGRLSRYPGERLLSGREPRDDGEHHRHAAGETVYPNSRARRSRPARAPRATPRSLSSSTSAKASTRPRPTCSRPFNGPPASCRAIFPARPLSTSPIRTINRSCYIALTSDTLSDGELYRYGSTQVQQRINILPGVSQVNIYGVKGAIRIKVDPGRAGLAQPDLRRICRPRSAPGPLTRVRANSTARTSRSRSGLTGRSTTAEGYRNIIIAAGGQCLAGLPARRRPRHRWRGERAALAPLFRS